MNLVALAAALTLAAAVYKGVDEIMRRRRDPLGEFLGVTQSGNSGGKYAQALGEGAARALPGLGFDLAAHLTWAQRGGYYRGQGAGHIMVTALAYGMAGGVFFLLTRSVAGLVAIGLGFAWPLLDVRSKANAVRKRTARSAPELASLLAAEMAAGTAPEAALRRAAELPGPLSALVEEAAAMSQRTGRPLLSMRGVNGTLMEVFGQCGLPALQTMGLQLDIVAQKGVSGAERMSEIARMLAFEYRQRLMEETEKLENRLVGAVAAFYFVPMVILLLGSFFNAISSAL